MINTYEPYKDDILPMTVIRRLDAVFEPTKDKVLEAYEKYKWRLNGLTALLSAKQNGSGKAFYNTSPYTLKTLLEDPKNLRSNFENYPNGFSSNVQDINQQVYVLKRLNSSSKFQKRSSSGGVGAEGKCTKYLYLFPTAPNEIRNFKCYKSQ